MNLENSTASALPTAILENKGDIFVTGAANTVFGRTIAMQLDPLSLPSAIMGELINSGKITIEDSGVQRASDPRPTAILINSGDVSPTADVKIGNIDLMADNSIGLEIGSGVNPLSGVKVDGSNGVIRALGLVSSAVTIGNAIGTDTGDNLIGGIQNLNIFMDGGRALGIYLSDMPSVDDKNIILDDKVIQSMAFGDNAINGVMLFNNSQTNNVIIDSSLANVTDLNKGADKRVIVNTGLSLKNYMPITIISSENAGGTAIVNSGRPDDVSLENYGDITINSECPTCSYIGDVVTTVGIINDRGVMKNFSNITINADNVYAVASNNGTITLNDGDITVNGDYATGIVSFYQRSGPVIQPIINLESGNIYLNGSNGQVFYIGEGIIGLGSAGNTVNATVSGKNSYLFSKLYVQEQYFPGKFNINGDVNSIVDNGAAAFYYKGQVYPDPYYPPMDFLSDLSNLYVINNGTLSIDVKDDGYLFGITETGLKVSDLENIQLSGINLTGSKRVKLANSTLYIDSNSNLDYQNNTGNTGYRDLDYFDTDIFLDSGITVTGTENRQTGMKLAGAAASFLYHYGENNGTINLSGDNSIGAYARNSKIVNNGLINLENSQNGTGIYAELYEHQSSEPHFYRNTEVDNQGDIKIGENGIGIYANTKKNPDLVSSNLTMIVNNAGNITGTGANATGIYLDNSTLPRTSNGSLTLASTSNIDLQNSKNGIGIYIDTANIGGTDAGTITVGENGIGIYAKNETVALNNLTLNLYGDNAVGIYTDGTNSFTGNGTINVDGKGLILFNIMGSGNFNQNFNIVSTSDSSYTLANIRNNKLYSNSSANLAENGIFINGNNSAVLLEGNSNLTSNDSNVTGIALNGTYALGLPVVIDGQTLNQEATNQGIMSFGNDSTGIYTVNGASAKNEGILTLRDNSVGIYGKGAGTGVSNTNNITVGENSVGLFLQDGKGITNDGEIKSFGEKTVGIYSENINNLLVSNSGDVTLTGDKSTGIYAVGIGAQTINNSGRIQVGDSSTGSEPSIGIYNNSSNNIINNTGEIISGIDSIGIYNNGGQINQTSGKVKIVDSGVGIYSDSGNINLSGGTLDFSGTDIVGIYGINGALIDNNTQLNIGNGNYGVVLNSGADLINRNSSVIGDQSALVYSDSGGSITNESGANLTMAGSNSTGFYMINGGDIINKASITGNTGLSNIGIYNQSGNITNSGDIKVGNSVIIDPLNPFINRYAVGIYGEDTQSIKNTGNIEIGADAVGFYVKESQTEASNAGNITSNSDKAIGIYLESSALRNTGNITLSGDNSLGIAAERNSTVKNAGIITMNGNNSIGIYANSNSNVVNESTGKIYINGNDSTGVQLSGGSTLENYGLIQVSSGTIGSVQTVVGSPGYTPPSIINAGVIKVDEKFDLNGINIVIKSDPASFRAPTIEEITADHYAMEDVGAGFLLTNTVSIIAPSFNFGSKPIGIDPNFTQGTNARVYKFENVFDPTTLGGGPNTGEIAVKSGSLTFDAIPVTNDAGKIDVWMEKINYDNFTQGAWYDNFAKNIEGNYLNATGDALKLYDKLDLVTDVDDLRSDFSQLAGSMYANITQREQNINDVFDNALDLLQNSENNTKENVKINIMAGKGSTKEDTSGVESYDYETYGVLALREVERTYRHKFGYSLGYTRTDFQMNDTNNEDQADTIQLGLHNKYSVNGWNIKNDLLGRVSFHDVDRSVNWSGGTTSELNSNYNVYGVSSLNELGKDIEISRNTKVTPYVGLELGYMVHPSFEEKGGPESLKVNSNDAYSVKPNIGVRLDGEKEFGKTSSWKVKGNIGVGYEYELGNMNSQEKASLTTLEDGYHDLAKAAEDKGRIKTSGYAGVELKETYGIYVTGEYGIGENNQEDYKVGITLKAMF